MNDKIKFWEERGFKFVRPDPDCGVCGGEGTVDSGGFSPQDQPVSVACPLCMPESYNRTGPLCDGKSKKVKVME